MISASQLSKNFGAISAVSNVSFTAAAGEVVGLLGLNGAGKTTTLRMLTTFLKPTSGKASVCGFDIQTDSAEVRKQIGYLPDNPPLYEELTVLENLKFAGQLRGIDKITLASRCSELLQRCSLEKVTRRVCGELSRGFRQRVGLAQALIHDPAVIILDEPTNGLDPRQVQDFRELIISLKANKTILLSTHLLSEVAAVCSKIVCIHQGRSVLEQQLKPGQSSQEIEQFFLKALNSSDPSCSQGSSEPAALNVIGLAG